jgi:hypothetical protein
MNKDSQDSCRNCQKEDSCQNCKNSLEYPDEGIWCSYCQILSFKDSSNHPCDFISCITPKLIIIKDLEEISDENSKNELFEFYKEHSEYFNNFTENYKKLFFNNHNLWRNPKKSSKTLKTGGFLAEPAYYCWYCSKCKKYFITHPK